MRTERGGTEKEREIEMGKKVRGRNWEGRGGGEVGDRKKRGGNWEGEARGGGAKRRKRRNKERKYQGKEKG